MKSFHYLSLLLILASCSSVRTVEGRAKPVYFSADDVVFGDTFNLSPTTLFYSSPQRLNYPCSWMVELEPGNQVKTYIVGPTIFIMNGNSFMINPGDRIKITADSSKEYSPSFSTLKTKKKRDRELQVLKRFEELEKAPKVPRLIDYNYNNIVEIESTLKSKIAAAEHASQLLLDSLNTAYKASRKFRRSTSDFIHDRYLPEFNRLYTLYRDTLFARQVYYDKVRVLLANVNNLEKQTRLSVNTAFHIDQVYSLLFPLWGIKNMVRQASFDLCFDSVNTAFTGPARDLLLTRLMLGAYKLGYDVPTNYEEQYRKTCTNKNYRQTIARAKLAFDTVQTLQPSFPNDLLLADGSETHWKKVLNDHRGKYVLIDFWASWCIPCMNDNPFLEALKKRYPEDKIVFLSLSVDANVNDWKRRMVKLNSDTATNYLFVHPGKAEMLQSLKVNEIPRYVLIDPGGQVADSDLPGPQSPELTVKLNKLLGIN